MSRIPTLSYVLCSVPPLLNCNTKESMWDLLMKYLCPRDFRRGEMEEKMKGLIKRLCTGFLALATIATSLPTTVYASEKHSVPLSPMLLAS